MKKHNKTKRKAKPKKRLGKPRVLAKNKTKRKSNFWAPVMSAAGSALGSMTDVPGVGVVGGLLGRKAGDWLSKITGFGDYKVQRNTLMSNNVPAFGSSSTRIRHREFVTDVVTDGNGFHSQTYTIQPANDLLFPWLSAIAKNYSEYKLHGMVFQYKSTSATAIGSTNTALGSVILATHYDVLAPPFTDKKSMEAHEFCVSAAPDENVIHPIECDPALCPLDVLYVQDSSVVVTSDQRFHDFGRFQIATQGQQAQATIGELWISYDIEFLKPKVHTSGTNISYHCSCLPNASIWNTDVKPHSGSSSFIEPLDGGLETRFYKSGRYLVIQNCSGVLNGPVVPPTMVTGCTLVPFFRDHSATYISNAGTANFIMFYVIDVVVDPILGLASYIPGNTTTITSVSDADTFIVEISTSLTSGLINSIDTALLKRLGLGQERTMTQVIPSPVPLERKTEQKRRYTEFREIAREIERETKTEQTAKMVPGYEYIRTPDHIKSP